MTYSTEQLKAMCPMRISECSQKHVQSVVAELIETALAQPASVPAGWKIERATQDRIRVASPDGELWSFTEGCGVSAYEFVYRLLDAVLSAAPQPEAQPSIQDLAAGAHYPQVSAWDAAPSAQAGPYRCPAKRGEDPQVCWRVRCQLGRKCADEVQAEQGGK